MRYSLPREREDGVREVKSKAGAMVGAGWEVVASRG